MIESEDRSVTLSGHAPLGREASRSCVLFDRDPPLVPERHALLDLFKPLIKLGRQRKLWSPTLIAVELWGLLTNLGTQRKITRLFKSEPFDAVARSNPRVTFKYLAPYYLAMGLTVSERASCFLHHYRRLSVSLHDAGLREILTGIVTLYEVTEAANRFALTISSVNSPLDKDMEGELSLNLRENGEKLFDLSFTIVPGSVVKSDDEEVIWITRLQGKKGGHTEIKRATKAFQCGTPSSTLITALQGIGLSLGIRGMAAVVAENHNCYRREQAPLFKKAYDDAFVELGMLRNAGGFFWMPILTEDKLSKSRARQKKAFKHEVSRTFSKLLIRSVNSAADSSGEALKNQVSDGFESHRTPNIAIDLGAQLADSQDAACAAGGVDFTPS